MSHLLTELGHHGAINMFWLYFWSALMSAIFNLSQWNTAFFPEYNLSSLLCKKQFTSFCAV